MWWQTSNIVKVCSFFLIHGVSDKAWSNFWGIEDLGFFLHEVASSDAMLLDLTKSFQFWVMCGWSVKGASNVYPIFVLDPWFLAPDPTTPSPGSKLVGINRIRCLLQSLQNLDDNLWQHGSLLLLMNGNPTTVISELLEKVSFYSARFCTSCQWSILWGDSWWYFLISFVSIVFTRIRSSLTNRSEVTNTTCKVCNLRGFCYLGWNAY